MSDTGELVHPGLYEEIGDPAGILEYQFKDPLRGRVPESERVDLGKHLKINGRITFLGMPETLVPVAEFPEMYSYTGEHYRFYDWCREHELYTLAYSSETLSALLTLENLDPAYITSIALELYPASVNAFLARLHGRQACYVKGCHELLCRTHNTIQQRERYLADSESSTRDVLDAAVLQVTESYHAYLDYIHQLMFFRRQVDGTHSVKYRHWHRVSKKQSILFDVTDESEHVS